MRFHRGKEEEPEEELQKPTRAKKVKEENDFEWDKKRISVGLIILAIGFIGFMEIKDRVFTNPAVLGTSAVNKSTQVQELIEAPKINLESDINTKIGDLKESVNALNADDVASSSPQIQKVLNDIQGIKDLPANQAKDACMKICSGI